ncbi:hypothetical protein [Streptomyces tricolor]
MQEVRDGRLAGAGEPVGGFADLGDLAAHPGGGGLRAGHLLGV